MKNLFLLLFLLISSISQLYSQGFNNYSKESKNNSIPNQLGRTTSSGIVNSYYTVSSLVPCNRKALDVINPVGLNKNDIVLIHQAKGATVDSSNNSNAGTVLNYNTAGQYEFNLVDTVIGSRVYLQRPYNYFYNPIAGLQLVKVYKEDNMTLTGNISAKKWNGSNGGIIAIISKKINLNSFSIQANGAGFRGGTVSRDFYQQTSCGFMAYNTDSLSGFGGKKGESFSVIGNSIIWGRGKLGSGGGGGNCINAGGGGGGNYGQGGVGGNEWSGCINFMGNGGIGGLSLSTTLNSDTTRIFFGSGGGGGQQNNSGGSSGGAGGGIIFLLADTILSNNGKIESNGDSSLTNTSISGDGTGGGGAGGSIFLNSKIVTGNLVINTLGGRSGNNSSNHPYPCIGTGGGGGGGVLVTSLNAIPANITFSSWGGVAGINYSTNGACNMSTYGATAGSPGGVVLSRTPFWSNAISTPLLLSGYPDTLSTCIGSNITIPGNGTGVSQYSWTGPGFTSASQNPTINNVSSANSGTYTLIANSTIGCSDTVKVYLKVIDIASLVQFPSDTNVCLNSTSNYPLSLNLPQNAQYQISFAANQAAHPAINNAAWLNAPFVSQNAPIGSNNVRYSIKYNNCTYSYFQNLNINTRPVISNFPDTINGCIGQNVTITGNIQGANQINWTGPSSFSSNQSNFTLSNVNSINTGTYFLKAFSNSNCADSLKVFLQVIDLSKLVVFPNDTNVCLPQGTNYQVSFSIPSSSQYQVSIASNSTSHPIISSQTWMNAPFVPVNIPLGYRNIRYSVLYKGCIYSAFQNVNSGNSPSNSTVIKPSLICFPDSTALTVNSNTGIVFTLSLIPNNVIFTDTLSSSSTNLKLNLNPGKYLMTFVDTNNLCKRVLLDTLEVKKYPDSLIFEKNIEICPGDKIELPVQSNVGSKLSWGFLNSNTTAFVSPLLIPENQIFTANTIQIFSNLMGCITKDNLIIDLKSSCEGDTLFIPNVFSPNSDGLNDLFRCIGKAPSSYSMLIYNRWGQNVFSTENFYDGWNGQFNGINASEGMYTFIVRYKYLGREEKLVYGSLSLLR